MNTGKLVFAILLLFVLSPVSLATTWGEAQVDDPIKEGAKCEVNEPGSYGSYIYSWPSKYDQVFWPITVPQGIWYCSESGFVAFIGDFDGITDKEKADIAAYLKNREQKLGNGKDLLVRLEEIYALRDKDDAFRNKLNRVLARWYQDLEDIGRANEYRRVALAEIERWLQKGGKDEGRRLEYLYLAANYTRLFGKIEASDEYIARLEQAAENVRSEKLKGFAGYLLELVEDTAYITPGGALNPRRPEKKSDK